MAVATKVPALEKFFGILLEHWADFQGVDGDDGEGTTTSEASPSDTTSAPATPTASRAARVTQPPAPVPKPTPEQPSPTLPNTVPQKLSQSLPPVPAFLEGVAPSMQREHVEARAQALKILVFRLTELFALIIPFRSEGCQLSCPNCPCQA